jgi:hypothetical protein
MKKIGVVITTISNGDFLKAFIPAVSEVQGKTEVIFYIVGDLNTPAVCEQRCKCIIEEGIDCRYLSVEAQDLLLKKIGFSPGFIPYRSDNRRNVGYMKAFEENCEILISMDDDNFPVESDFFLKHSLAGSFVEAESVLSDTKWVNPMIFLNNQTTLGEKLTMYPRGFPYKERWKDNTRIMRGNSVSGSVGVNVGLWTGDPDIDAISRMTTLCQSSCPSGQHIHGLYALSGGCRMPINSQNTALTREAIFAYYFIKMGYRISDLSIDRFGDIFSGYFVQLCVESVGQLITLGDPLVCQVRNEHNLLKDLKQELPGILLIEEMMPFLESKLPAASSYADAYLNLVENLQQFSSSGDRSEMWKSQGRYFINEISEIMKAWVRSLNILK